MGVPGAARIGLEAIDRGRRAAGHETRGIERVDGHVEQQHILHLLAEAAEMGADEEVTVEAGDVAQAPLSMTWRMRRTPSTKRRFCTTAWMRPAARGLARP